MFGNKKLKEKVEILEDKIKDLKVSLDGEMELSEFLLNHNKEDIVVEATLTNSHSLFMECLRVKYIYGNKVITITRPCGGIYFPNCVKNIIDLNNKQVLIHIVDMVCRDEYWMLDKEEQQFVNVTNVAKYYIDKYDISNKLESDTNKLKDIFVDLTKESKNANNDDNKQSNVVGKKTITRNRKSVLKKYYENNKLDLNVKDFHQNSALDETDVATLLYLYDKYKYLDEIAKHINLNKNSLVKYTYIIRKEGYLIYNHGIGRVANGALIYNK